MNNNTLERSEKSTPKTVERDSDSSLVAEAWALERTPTSRSGDSLRSMTKTQAPFLDMGTSDSLYGKNASEPGAVGRVEPTSADATTGEEADAQKRKRSGHIQLVPEKAKSEQKSISDQIGLGTARGVAKVAERPVVQPRMMHPDRLEDIGKTRPEEVERYHDGFKKYEHKQLEDWAKKNLTDPAELFRFQQDMRDFELRAKTDGLATADVTTTYQQIKRLTAASGETPLTTLERNRLAIQVMHQAAHPTSIDQGQHKTCNVTTVESRAYSRTPAQAARLVADVALNGEYRAKDGTTVKLDPKGHHESLQYPTPYGARTHASEIFQVTAVNLFYEKQNALTGSKIRYEQVEPKAGEQGDLGERLMDYSGPEPKEVMDDKGPVRRPRLYDGELTAISNLISSRSEEDVTLVSDKWTCSADNVCKLATEEEFTAKLKDLKARGMLTAILRVNTIAEPFYTDSGNGTAGGSGGAHVVTVTDFDEKNGTASVDNQWGWGVDHVKSKPISIHDLYISMQSDQDIEALLKKDVQRNAERNILDPAKEIQMLRMQKANKSIDNNDYVQSMNAIIENTKKSWDTDKVSKEQRLEDQTAINRMIQNGIPVSDQMMLMRKEHQLGIVDYETYRTKLTFAGVRAEEAFKTAKDSPVAAIERILATATLNSALLDLNPQDREWVRQNIQILSKDS